MGSLMGARRTVAPIVGRGVALQFPTHRAAMAAELPCTRITQTMWIHPTVTELLPTLFGKLKPLV